MLQRHILIVEDDESIALGLQMNLEAEGYSVETVGDGESGLARGVEGAPDLMIVDVMLPQRNGFEVVRGVRERGSKVPIIMLSARGAETDKVMGLNYGAEDYITKPFSLAELLARVKAVLRRSELLAAPVQVKEESLQFGELEVDPRLRQVLKNGVDVELTATEFDILWCLVSAQGAVLSREDIQTAVWGPGHHGTLRTIDNFLLQLRTKLETDPARPRHLLTVRGVGYRFAP